MATYKLLLLPGDGIGPEVMSEVEKVLARLAAMGVAKFEIEQGWIPEGPWRDFRGQGQIEEDLNPRVFEEFLKELRDGCRNVRFRGGAGRS